MSKFINDKCRNCGDCMLECLSEAISAGSIFKIDGDKCIDCGVCVPVCKYKAIIDRVEPIEESENE